MIDACGKFARKYPVLTLLMCGIFISALPVGLGMNARLLDERDLIPDQVRSLMPLIGIFQAVFGLTGFILIGMSVFFAVRRWTTPQTPNPPVP